VQFKLLAEEFLEIAAESLPGRPAGPAGGA